MNKTVKKLLILIGVVAVFVVFCMLLNLRGVETFEDKYAGHDLTADAEGAVREGTYTRYLKNNINCHISPRYAKIIIIAIPNKSPSLDSRLPVDLQSFSAFIKVFSISALHKFNLDSCVS